MALANRSVDASQVHPLLELQSIDFAYNTVQVLFGVSLSVRQGERIALLGANGAGKSTLLNVVSGILRPSSGQVVFDGADITALTPAARVRLGIVQMAGGRATFPSLTVEENVRIGLHPFVRRSSDVRARLADVMDLFPTLKPKLRQHAGTLSGGEQQLMALARVLAMRPRLLMIDELSLGLSPVAVQQVVQAADSLVESGTTTLLVEQSINVAFTLAQHGSYMEKGEIKFTGSVGDLLASDSIARSVFLGAANAEVLSAKHTEEAS